MATKRKETPDLMGDLLGKGTERRTPKQNNSTAPVTTETEAVQESKESFKTTVYLSQDAVDGLDELKFTLRRLLRPANKHSVSKSSIVEALVLYHLQEVQEQAGESALAQLLQE